MEVEPGALVAPETVTSDTTHVFSGGIQYRVSIWNLFV